MISIRPCDRQWDAFTTEGLVIEWWRDGLALRRRWLFIRRETGIPDAAEVSNRWAVDHSFIVQDGIPTLVEVKRSSDSRIRREVVGQLLDYAANAVAYCEAPRVSWRLWCARTGS